MKVCYHEVMNQKRYTIKDIAEACNVSTATVSYVLNDVKNQSISAETKNRILHYAHLVGYASSSSARALATGHSGAVGLYVPELTDGRGRLLRALTEELETNGLSALLLTDRCRRRRVTDVEAILAVDIPEEEFHCIGENSFVPLLYIDGKTPDDLFYCFCFDAQTLRSRVEAQTGCAKVVFAGKRPQSEHYAEYLSSVYDRVLTAREAVSTVFSADTAVITDSDTLCAALRAPHCLLLGSEAFPLPFQAYARAVVATALRAISRENPPAEHDIRIK